MAQIINQSASSYAASEVPSGSFIEDGFILITDIDKLNRHLERKKSASPILKQQQADLPFEPAPLMLDLIDTPLQKQRKRKKKHKKKSTEGSQEKAPKSKVPKKRKRSTELKKTALKQETTALRTKLKRKGTKSSEILLLTPGSLLSRSGEMVLTPKPKRKLNDSHSIIPKLPKQRSLEETKSVKTPRIVHEKKVDSELDAVKETEIIECPEIKTSGLSMRASTKAALDIITGGLIPVPLKELPSKARKPLPLATVVDTITIDNKSNAFSTGKRKKKRSKKQDGEKNLLLNPVGMWYSFQLDIIDAPDDTSLEEKATKTFDVAALIKGIKE